MCQRFQLLLVSANTTYLFSERHLKTFMFAEELHYYYVLEFSGGRKTPAIKLNLVKEGSRLFIYNKYVLFHRVVLRKLAAHAEEMPFPCCYPAATM